MVLKRDFAVRHLPALAVFAVCAYCSGQTDSTAYRHPVEIVQGQPAQPATQPPAAPVPASAPSPKPVPGIQPPSAPATQASLLNQPAQPAKISLSAGKLSIQADNSSLSEILRQLSKDSGMRIEGLQAAGSADQRVFGRYGPDAPRDVLLDLLSGYGFNVLMLGATPSGVPRELALTSRTAGPPPGVQQPNAAQDQSQQDEPPAVIQEPQNYPQQPGNPAMRNGVKTPQQMLEELQRMRQQQEQQQQDQQDQDQQDPQPDQQR